MDDADICYSLLRGEAADPADATAEPLNTKEIALRIVRGHLKQEGAIPTSHVQLQRAR